MLLPIPISDSNPAAIMTAVIIAMVPNTSGKNILVKTRLLIILIDVLPTKPTSDQKEALPNFDFRSALLNNESKVCLIFVIKIIAHFVDLVFMSIVI